MSKFRLGTYRLPPGEMVLIRTLVRLFSQDAAFGWVLTDEGPYDALIVNDTLPSAHEAQTAPVASIVLKLTAGNSAPSPHTLQRPIKAEKLQGWLKTAALELSARRAAAPPASLAAIPQARFKLLRWPPNAVLQNDAKLIRMSTLLSRRALQLSELAELSHQSAEACLMFIEKLMPMQLIACEALATPTAGASFAVLQPGGAPAPKPASASAPMPFHRGLISGIRKRLGL
ncbi:MAG: hypothetical protein M3R45_12270 [Pseudomonadota bacterium]|nr:hypothetical protein [Pseudomonadota bacterium]